jgi:hypothetical protein
MNDFLVVWQQLLERRAGLGCKLYFHPRDEHQIPHSDAKIHSRLFQVM